MFNMNNKIAQAVLVWLILVALPLSVVEASNDTRAPRYFGGYQFDKAGLMVPIPIDPLWEYSVEKKESNASVLVNSPSLYYPSTNLEFTLFKEYKVTLDELKVSALTALNLLRKKNKLLEKKSIDDFEYVEYGAIKGYVDTMGLKLRGKPYTIKYLYGVMPSNQPILLTVGTPRGQMAHIEHVVTKIWNKLSVLPSALPDASLSAK